MKLYTYIFLFLLLLVGCDRFASVETKISRMKETPIVFPLDSMDVWTPHERITIDTNKAKYKMVVYVDTTNCSSCALKHMFVWNDFLKYSDEHDDILDFVFIIEARPGEGKSLKDIMYMTMLKHPIYIDNNRMFIRKNPSIPRETMFHTMLLDKNNNVILVGNPCKNEKIEKKLMQIINERETDRNEPQKYKDISFTGNMHNSSSPLLL